MPDHGTTGSCAFAFRADALRERLFEAGLPVYVFVDPLLADPFQGQAALETRVVRRVELQRFGLAPEQYSYFFQLTSSTDDLLEASLALAEQQAQTIGAPQSLCGWFQSALPVPVIATALRRSMVYHMPEGRRWHFRFFDPKVARYLPNIVGDTWKPAGLHGWWHLDGPEWRCMAGDMQAVAPAMPSDTQRAAIDRLGIINQAMTQWRQLQTEGELPANAYRRLDEAVVRAQALGMSVANETDMVAFALHRCLIHPRLENHPEVSRWIANASLGKLPYVDAAADADENTWRDIETGSWDADNKEIRHG